MKNARTQELCRELSAYFAANRREMPWREPDGAGAYDPYRIMVSEIMLQQTQVVRVMPKFDAFIHRFPDFKALAAAPLADVLTAWQGLGYNRRAKFLWQAARTSITDFDGILPRTVGELVRLPGIGINTAGAICAYAYNQPVIFIETNIRTVFIRHFFSDRETIHDNELKPLVQAVLDCWLASSGMGPREFYWALMDYGTYVKSTDGNSSRRSVHYTRQPAFTGSKRQLRGSVLRSLSAAPVSLQELSASLSDERLDMVCAELIAEGLISIDGDILRLGS